MFYVRLLGISPYYRVITVLTN